MPLDVSTIGITGASLPPLVIYHSPCMDGFTAAWAMWLKYPDAEFVQGVYGQEPPNCLGRDVYLLDFSYKRQIMDQVIAVATSVYVLDHHKSAELDLAGLESYWHNNALHHVTIKFDMTKSGARLAWEWFHPNTEVSLFVKLVEDRDLWRFNLPDSKAMNAAFFSYEYDFQRWNDLCGCAGDSVEYQELLTEGHAIERKHMKDVKELIAKLQHERYFRRVSPGLLDDIPCANLPYTMASDAAGLMAENAPFAATYYQDAEGFYVFSLRSRAEDGADVSQIATQYGGGGHKHAAGFRIKSLEDL